MPLDVARRGTLDYKDPPLRAIVAANDVYQAGYHNGDPGGLDAIDTDLATANIKNGITIFGKVGSADVHDISDATAVEAEVIAPETFYAVGGGIRTGTMPIVALAPGSSAYPAGYHAGDGGGLPAIDADLVTANIKNGITIFNVAGHVNVRDVSDANALVGEVMNGRTFYAVGGAIKTGTLPTRTLNPANENVLAGYYAGTTLSTVEVQLAAANILSGVNIFGFVGVATVQDIADADAVLADVKNGKTFYSVTGGRKTGNLATVAIAADNNAYPSGYHAGDGGGLSAIDVNLAAANILSGVNIFGFVGVATVQDIADANALVGEVLNPRTFYSVTGARKTGTMATVALAPGSNAYPAGYHVGAANLTAVDGDLVTANIKNGITIFNIAGHVNVRDVSDANALVGEVKNGRTFYAVGGAIKTGTMPTVAIVAGSSAYPTGYHAGHGGGLPAIDADLATGNIKFGITIFNIAGHTNVRDSSDANLTAPEAPTGKTFYAGGGARKTGSGTKTLNPANEVVAAGYYAATTLSAVDAQLAAANIKSGVNIFGFVGVATVQDIADADAVLADVKNGKTFYSVTGGRKTGNLATVALNAAANAYPAGYHVGAASLTAVDGDLAAGNIADGVTIFGVLGTLSATLGEDVKDVSAVPPTTTVSGFYGKARSVPAGADLSIAGVTLAFAAGSFAVAGGVCNVKSPSANQMKLRVFMDGVQVAESDFFSNTVGTTKQLVGTRALAGTKSCYLHIHNDDGSAQDAYVAGGYGNGSQQAYGLTVGSIKTV